MPGEALQNFRLLQPVLEELRGELDEIARHARPGDQRIGDVGEEAVQRVAELVEEGARVVEAEERRIARAGFGKIHHVHDDRPDVAVELLLAAKTAHPGAAPLRGPGEIVAEKEADVAAVPVRHVPGADVRMVERHVVALGEGEAEQVLRRMEGRRDDVVEREIRLDLAFVEIELGLAAFFGVIAPVPGRELEIAALRPDLRLQGGGLAKRLRPRRRPHRTEEVERRLRRLRHRVGEPEMREALIAEQAGPLGAERHRLGDDRPVVGGLARLAARRPGLEGGLAEVAAAGELQERLDGGAGKRDDMLAGRAAVFRRLCGRLAERFRESGKVVLAVQH